MFNVNQTWLQIVKDLIYRGKISRPRNMMIWETLSYSSEVDMNFPILTIPERKLGYRFMFREAWWIINGRNTLHDIKDYSKAISNFSNDGVYFDGAYGPRIVDQLRYVVDTLFDDPDTRQAVIEIWRPNPRSSKDIPCTINVQWFIRDNKIHCVDTMRSSDVWLGWPYDIFNFTMLTGYIMLLLRERDYNRFENLQLGLIHLNAGSQHLYKTNQEEARKIIETDELHYNSDLKFNPYRFNKAQELLDCLELLSGMDKPISYFKEVMSEQERQY